MEDSSSRIETADAPTPMAAEPRALGEMLREHNGRDVVVLDLAGTGAWTDFFVIATATSEAHLDGLERHVRELCGDMGLAILRRSFRPRSAISGSVPDEWRVIDLGHIVIHLMSDKARAFYDLERLYRPKDRAARPEGGPTE
jgi:ribosome-associated protein